MKLKYSLLHASLMLAMTPALAQTPEHSHKQKDEHDIEKVIVTATPLNKTVLETATPVTVLSGEQLDKNQAGTLGETLKNTPGVHSSYFGPVASSPIIRGLDGPRIKVVQNGLDSSDASRVGPDHVVATEAFTATQIEVLRGPATLLYGSGAIGGVVNVVDNRIPKEATEETTGELIFQHDTVSDGQTIALDLNGGSGNFAWHVDAFNRDTDNYEIPGPAEAEETHDHEDEGEEHAAEATGELANSSTNAQGFTLGGGWITDDYTVAFAYGRLESDYGIPGHAHGEEEHGHEGEEEEGHEGEESHAEEQVLGQLEQDRFQAMLDWKNLGGNFSEVHWHTAYTDYEHREVENGQVGTTFENDTFESRLWAKHKGFLGWQGILGLHYNNIDFSALGAEAFTPASKTDSLALFVLEEKKQGDLLWQLGGRIERTSISPDNNFFEGGHAHEHEGEEEHEEHEINFSDQDYTAVSLSAGVVWTVSEQHRWALNFAHSERAPSASEIFSRGAHIGTQTYEIGAGFEIHREGDEVELEQRSSKVKKETSNNIDLTYRYTGDELDFTLNLFYNQVDDYIFQQNTGLFAMGGEIHAHAGEEHHEEEEHEEEEHGHEDEHAHGESELPVFQFQQQDATLYGFEAELDYHLNDNWRLSAFTDYIRAELDDNTNVPRIPPLRFGSELHWENENWHAEVGVTRYSKQDKISSFETKTDGYTLVSANLNYYVTWGDADVTLFVKGENLTDEEARVHSSFLKNLAPIPGRNISLGIKTQF